FTNVAPIARATFHVSPNGASRGEQFREIFISHGARCVFVNGHFVPALSSLTGLPAGVYVSTILAALDDPAEARILQQHLAKIAGYADPAQSFVALNTASFEDGVYVRIPAGTLLANPISVC